MDVFLLLIITPLFNFAFFSGGPHQFLASNGVGLKFKLGGGFPVVPCDTGKSS